MPVNTEVTSRKSPRRTGEVELLEFFAKRRACGDQDREIACSDVRALARGIRNGVAGGDAGVAGRSHCGWQRKPFAYATFTSRRQFVDSLQTTNDLFRTGLE